MKRLACLILLVAGCGNPETDRLAVGSAAILVDHDKFNGQKDDQINVKGLNPRDSALATGLDQGTHVTIVDDERDPGRNGASRDVKVRIDDGPFKGETGEVTRWSLAPSR